MEINKDILLPYLMYNKPYQYSENITIYPVTMANVLSFQTLSTSITVRKNSIFHNKEIIKMNYLEFLYYSFGNEELESEYQINGLSQYLIFAIQLLQLCCKEQEVKIIQNDIVINGQVISPQIFDDLRRIIIIQNDIDFDIDEFINYDTEQRLKKAERDQKKDFKVNIEDYIDSLIIALNATEECIMNMTVRKFWRYIKRYNLREEYTFAKTGEYSGMVTFKNPIEPWMRSLDNEDRYENLKTNEQELRSKIG